MRSFLPVAAALVTAVTLTSCGGDSTSPPTPRPTSITFEIPPPTSLDALGDTVQLMPTVRDQNGNVIDRHLTWTSDAESVVTVSLHGEVASVANGVAHVTGTVGAISTELTFTVAQVPIYMVAMSGDSQTTALNTPLSQPLVVHVTDRLYHPVPSTVVSFSIFAGGGTLAAAADTTDSSGTAMDRWTSGTKAGEAIIQVSQRPGAALRFTETVTPGPANAVVAGAGDRQTAFPSAPLADSVAAQVVDAYGNPVSGIGVDFKVATGGGSVSPASATSGPDGNAWTHWTLGSTTGAQTLQASAPGLTTAPATISATASNLRILAVAPDTLVEGNTATISGQDFDPVAANDVVVIDGDTAIITAATTTQLTVTVPTFDCKPSRVVNVGVTAGAATAVPAAAPLRPASYLSVGVGQQVIVRPPSNLCLQFAASATSGESFLIGVGAAAESPGALNTVVLSGATGLSASASRFAATSLSGAPVSAGAPISPTPLQQEVAARWERQYQSEARLRALEAPMLRRLQSQRRPSMTTIPGISAAPVVPDSGAHVTYRVPQGPDNLCTQYAQIGGVVKYVGKSGIWVSDTANPNNASSLTDAEIKGYSDTLDAKIFAVDTSYFGAPSDIDNNGRIVIILSVQVNKVLGGGVAGFVFSGDLFPRSLCASSDAGEIFYGQVPDPDNISGTGARSKAAVTFQMPSLIAHEFTHDIQFSRRFIVSPTAATNVSMNSWEAEGQAMFAQNAVGDAVLGYTSGANNGWVVAHTGQDDRWYGQGFDLLASYFGFAYTSVAKNDNAPEQCTLFGGVTSACYAGAFYGAAYSFEKYVTDRYAATYPGGEKGLHRDIIDKNPGLAGAANWTTTVGFDFDSVFAQWGAMLYMDDRVPGLAPELQFPSWNLANIFSASGYNNSIAYLTPYQQGWSDFSMTKSLRDGSTLYTVLSAGGPHGPLAVKVRGPLGAVLSSGDHPLFWVVRIQ